MVRVIRLAGIVWILLVGIAQAQGLSDVRAGNLAFKEGDLERAVDLYGSAIESGELSDDALSITLNNRGVVLGELGDFDAAIHDYLVALELRPNDGTTLKNLRVAYVHRGQQRQLAGDKNGALSDFDAAIESQPDHHLAYFYRSQLYAEQGDLELALIDLERATMLKPDDAEARKALEQVEHDLASARELPGSMTDTTDDGDDRPKDTASTTIADVAPSGGPATPPTAALDGSKEPTSPTPDASATSTDTPQSSGNGNSRVAVEPPDRQAPTAPSTTFDVTDGAKMRTTSAVNYRGGPSNEDPRLGTVDAGAIVTVVGDTLGWKHVILPNGDHGFIYKRWLEPIAD